MRRVAIVGAWGEPCAADAAGAAGGGRGKRGGCGRGLLGRRAERRHCGSGLGREGLFKVTERPIAADRDTATALIQSPAND